MKSTQAMVNPIILSWARERAGFSVDDIAQKLHVRVQALVEWEQGTTLPTFKQAQRLAKATRVPFPYFYLAEPPVESFVLPDLRTIEGGKVKDPSPDLRAIVQQVLKRQEWYIGHLEENNNPPLPFVGKYQLDTPVKDVVLDIRQTLQVQRPIKGKWEQYFRDLIVGAEEARILVMRSGIVGSDTHRKLDIDEFRGFAIADALAPVIFINSADAPSARLFTLIHELAHLWLGSSGISDLNTSVHRKEEVFCNAVAGEFLVPTIEFESSWNYETSFDENLSRLASHFYVSTMVIARKALDCGLISRVIYREHYKEALSSFRAGGGGGGNYYTNTKAKNSTRFSNAVIYEALSGKILLRDAGKLLGVSPSNIRTYAKELAK